MFPLPILPLSVGAESKLKVLVVSWSGLGKISTFPYAGKTLSEENLGLYRWIKFLFNPFSVALLPKSILFNNSPQHLWAAALL
jgi:hypothetical protein